MSWIPTYIWGTVPEEIFWVLHVESFHAATSLFVLEKKSGGVTNVSHTIWWLECKAEWHQWLNDKKKMVHTEKCYWFREQLHGFNDILYCSTLLWWEWVSRTLFVKRQDPSFHGPWSIPVHTSCVTAHSLSAATLPWLCFTPSYGSTRTSPFCHQQCWTLSAPRRRSSLVCCPVLCPSSLSCHWRR